MNKKTAVHRPQEDCPHDSTRLQHAGRVQSFQGQLFPVAWIQNHGDSLSFSPSNFLSNQTENISNSAYLCFSSFQYCFVTRVPCFSLPVPNLPTSLHQESLAWSTTEPPELRGVLAGKGSGLTVAFGGACGTEAWRRSSCIPPKRFCILPGSWMLWTNTCGWSVSVVLKATIAPIQVTNPGPVWKTAQLLDVGLQHIRQLTLVTRAIPSGQATVIPGKGDFASWANTCKGSIYIGISHSLNHLKSPQPSPAISSLHVDCNVPCGAWKSSPPALYLRWDTPWRVGPAANHFWPRSPSLWSASGLPPRFPRCIASFFAIWTVQKKRSFFWNGKSLAATSRNPSAFSHNFNCCTLKNFKICRVSWCSRRSKCRWPERWPSNGRPNSPRRPERCTPCLGKTTLQML